ncbi:TspO/MBR family-domain-containing protein [Schizothecium vesticola]|uniref:TspO/MBR family-domain-containing protein n=1 Tax=Schizothecium vesticola TaxID=314040 RepID=A0AA40EUR5_9PEZI|nr:TspO/MBR family-domain-containing protein [Schizothecium vesticola]
MTTYIPNLTLPSFIFNSPAASILLPIALGTGVGYATQPRDNQRQYMSWKQPPLRPPPWIFGPVWTALYGMMGYSAYRAVHLGTSPLNMPHTISAAKHGATLYTIQLALNMIWMPLFFGLRRPVEATVDIVALLGVNGYLAWLWGTKVDEVSGWLLVPYIGWLSFATYLSAATGYLNNWDLRSHEEKARGKKGQ